MFLDLEVWEKQKRHNKRDMLSFICLFELFTSVKSLTKRGKEKLTPGFWYNRLQKAEKRRTWPYPLSFLEQREREADILLITILHYDHVQNEPHAGSDTPVPY
jgi:hypothetical protein